MSKQRGKGQSILEYTLLLGVIIAALVFVLLGQGETGIKNKVQNTYNAFGDAITKTTTDLTTGVFQ
jgi:Flp pilus assembly pilin Flp